MAEQLKHILNDKAVNWLADSIARVYPAFDRPGFTAASLLGLDALELKQRARHIAAALKAHLPDFPAAARILEASLGPEIPATGEDGGSVLRYMPHDSFIEQFGVGHPREAFALQAQLTKRFTCEFSIRAFLVRHPDMTYAKLTGWARDQNPHLRRLASEGSRPRLPWAQRLPSFQKDPAPVIALLETLKDDPERYVQRSVANNINDISKDHPDIAVGLCREWLRDAPAGREWIVKHAMRDLVKKGHIPALELFGAGNAPQVTIGGLTLSPDNPQRGGALRFSFDLVSAGADAQGLIVDFTVHFVKANGKTRPKTFKLGRLALAAGQTVRLGARVSFADMTTRKHYAGLHRIEAQINGMAHDLGAFELG